LEGKKHYRRNVAEETTGFPLLLSGTTLILALAVFYLGRALWIARREWPQCSLDTKILYLLVAPLLTFAVDVLELTDRWFWSRQGKVPQPVRRPARHAGPLRPKTALRSDS
jgi:hypothetical protein